MKTAAHKPSVIELVAVCSNAVRVVNERPITALSEDSREFTVMTLVLLVTPGMDFYTHVEMAHYCDHLRRNYWFDVVPAERFW